MHIFDKLKDREPLQSDHQLLQRFGDHQDQAAFGLIVKRHGEMVQRLCRGIGLRDHDIDDVFQATFLVVAQRARTLQWPESLGPFIHGTAYRLAMKVLRFSRQQRANEQAAAKPESRSEGAGAEGEASVSETQGLIHSELAGLADKYRVPLILHFLEGKTHDETARQLGMPRRTVSRRIQRGTELLRKRLARHGIEISAVTLAVLFGSKAQAAIAPALAAATAQSAALFVQGSAPASKATLLASSGASGLAKLTGPVKAAGAITIWMSKTAVVALVGVACAGVWYETRSPSGPASGFAVSPETSALQNMPLVVRGRILDGEGKPVPRAQVALLASRPVRGERGQHDEVLREGQAGADGAFALEVPEEELLWVRKRGQLKVLASAAGRALGAVAIQTSALSESTDIRLGASGNVRGQVVDQDSKPAVGVAVHVVGYGLVGREVIQGSDALPPAALTGWPQPVITDHDGRFSIAGLDPQNSLSLEVRDARFGRQLTLLNNQPDSVPKPAVPEDNVTIKLAPPQVLEGQVLAAGTQKPVPFARLSMIPVEPLEQLLLVRHHVDARADAAGRFRMQPLPGGAFRVFACGQDNDPYLIVAQTVTWPRGTMHKEMTLTLERGVPVHGQIVEAETGRAVAGTQVEYTEVGAPHRESRNDIYSISQWWGDGFTHTGADGRFLIPVFPGQGELRVPFNRDEFQLRLLTEGGSGAFVPTLDKVKLEIPVNCTGKELRLVLQRWGQLNGQVVDGDRKPVSSGLLVTAGQFAQNPFRGGRKFEVRDGSFFVTQTEVDGTYPIVLIDTAHRQGVSTSLKGNNQNPGPRFALEPCGLAAGKLVTTDGQSFENAPIDLAIVLPYESHGSKAEPVEMDWYAALNRDQSRETTSRGKFVLPALVPGVRYRLYARKGDTRHLVKEFTVESGQKLQLGSLVVTK